MLVSPTLDIFAKGVPLLDVRAEVEFDHGAFPASVNIPILTNAERERVGITYRFDGPEAAVDLGHVLVGGEIKVDRVNLWRRFVAQHPNALLYCFRGGQRSSIAAEWLAEAGVEIARVNGGYKAMRRLLIESLAQLPKLTIVGGRTGVGKTQFLHEIAARTPEAVVDLEGLANHRGSAFGKRVARQPTQINFENALAVELLKRGRHVLLEDEGRMVGKVNLPLPVQQAMASAPVLLIEDSLTNRVERIYREYIEDMAQQMSGTQHRDMFLGAIDAIRKRLGGANHQEIRSDIEAAFVAQARGNPDSHRIWIKKLLVLYYDPMYDYQLKNKSERICFRGDGASVAAKAQALIDCGQ